MCRCGSCSEGLQSWSCSVLILGIAVIIFFFYNPVDLHPEIPAEELPNSIYDITVRDLHEYNVSLSAYKGQVLLIVNVASLCAFTNSNYEELNVLKENYKDKGFEILAFPCNQFGGQEPGSNEEIEELTCKRFNSKFPIFDKIEVNGKNASVLYKFLKSKKGGVLGEGIKWNFTKFLVDKDGNVVNRYAPTTSPLKIEKDIRKLLGLQGSDVLIHDHDASLQND